MNPDEEVKCEGLDLNSFDNIDVMKYEYTCDEADYKKRKQEVGLFLLGTFSDDIVKYSFRQDPGEMESLFE